MTENKNADIVKTIPAKNVTKCDYSITNRMLSAAKSRGTCPAKGGSGMTKM